MLFCIKNRRSTAKKCGRYGRFPVAGVIGDVDGDGELDQVAIVNNEGEMYGGTVNTFRTIKMNEFDAVKTRGRYRSKLTMYVSEEMRNVRGIKPLEDIKFRPMTEQQWTQYMGSLRDEIYRGNG